MENPYNLLKIYGIPPAPYSENNPDDLFLKNLPSLEQIASFNLALQSQPKPTGIVETDTVSTPVTTIIPGNQSTDLLNFGAEYNMQNPAPTSLSSMSSTQGNAMDTSQNLAQQITDFSNPYPVTAESIQYLNGFIRTQIGRRAQIQFLVGSTDVVEKDGFILGVGANYILINEIGTDDITACDFYNIKFIRFLY